MLESSWPNACSSENHPKQRIDELLQAGQGKCGFTQHLVNRFFFLLSLLSSSFTKRQERESNDCLWVLAAPLLKGSWSLKLEILGRCFFCADARETEGAESLFQEQPQRIICLFWCVCKLTGLLFRFGLLYFGLIYIHIFLKKQCFLKQY